MSENLFLSCDEFAKLLSIKLSTVYSWLHYKQLPNDIYVKLGRKPIFIKDKVVDWILSGAKLNSKQNKLTMSKNQQILQKN